MKKLWFCFALVIALAFTVPAFAAFNGQIPDNGTHYQINIIGVSKDKKVDMNNSDRRTIFVPLDTSGRVDKSVKISYQIGPDFQVLDGNATDSNGALIQVPYEYCEDLTAGCEELLSFNVYAVALGKPNGYALVEAHCTYSEDVVVGKDGTAATTCEETLLMSSFDIRRDKGKPTVVNISDIFRASGCLDLDGDTLCDAGDLVFNNIWIFNIPQLTSYFWDYTNTGLKLMQVRFYPTTSGTIGYK